MIQQLLKILITGIGIGAIAYLSICISLFLLQNRLIFLPSSIIENTPDELGLTYSDIWLSIPTKAGKIERIHGWWIPSAQPTSKVLLYLHGNGVNIEVNLEHAQRFHKLGFSVFLIDYRGYGKSKGKFPTEKQVYEDAQIAYDYLVEERGIKPENIMVYGHSLGGAIAINLAVNRPKIAGLIVQSSFTSIEEIVDHQGIYVLFPIDLILHHKFDSMSKISRLEMPILLIHGTEDKTVPSWMSESLYNAAKVPKKLLIVPEAGHNNVAKISGEKYLQTVQEFYSLIRNSALTH